MFYSLGYEEDILVDTDTIMPRYEVRSENGEYIIFGTETTSGEAVIIKGIPGDEKSLCETADFLNRNNVSVFHAKDVIRDRLFALLDE